MLKNVDDDDRNSDCITASEDEDEDVIDADNATKPLAFARAASVRFSHSRVNPSSPFSRASRGGGRGGRAGKARLSLGAGVLRSATSTPPAAMEVAAASVNEERNDDENGNSDDNYNISDETTKSIDIINCNDTTSNDNSNNGSNNNNNNAQIKANNNRNVDASFVQNIDRSSVLTTEGAISSVLIAEAPPGENKGKKITLPSESEDEWL